MIYIQDTGAHIKVYTECAPLSTERVVQINGSPRVIVKCFSTIFDIVQTVWIMSSISFKCTVVSLLFFSDALCFISSLCYYSMQVVLCEYSKFRIESNSYLLFDSIRNWRNYSKFSNTYSTVISQATETRFVCTLPATSRCTRPSLNPVLCRMCAPTPPTPLTTAGELLQAPVSTVTSDCVITAVGKRSAWSVEHWTFCQYC